MRLAIAITFVSSAIFAGGISAQDLKPERPKRTTVYKTDFGKDADLGPWMREDKSGIEGAEGYHGPYTSFSWESFNLPKLEPHQFVRVKATLVVAGTLDGHHPKLGPDNWALGANRAGILFLTSFANDAKGERGDAEKRQSFPDEISAGSPHAPGTGAVATNSLNLGVAGEHAAAFANADNTYELDLTFPHQGASLVLNFYTFFDAEVADELWAFRDFEVEIVSGSEPLTIAELEKLWATLTGKDSMAAHRALWELAASGSAGLDYANKRWQEANGKIPLPQLKEKFAALFAQLDSDVFIERAAARSEMAKLGEDAIPLIEAALKKRSTPVGVKQALDGIRKKLAPPVDKKPDLVKSRLDHLRRLFAKRGRDYVATASRLANPPHTAHDGLWPTLSTQGKTPRFTFWNQKGTTEWLQYDFPDKRRVTAGEVFWLRNTWPSGNKLPKAWRLKWRDDDGNFHEVKLKPESAYAIEEDKFNRAEFDPVETTAIRLELDLSDTNTGGLHEFQLDEKPVGQ